MTTSKSPVQAGKLPRCRPLATVSAASWCLDRNAEEVLAMIEEGELLWAFDIALPNRRGKPCPRILTASIEAWLSGQQQDLAKGETQPGLITGLVFPGKPTIDGYELARALNCGRQHALDLIRQQFRLVSGSHIRRGPGGSPQIETASAADWLMKRRMM